MLDADLIAQLRNIYASLSAKYSLVMQPGDSPQHAELREILQGLALASPRIKALEQGKPSDTPQVDLLKDGAPTGVRFRGVPAGHEFNSLVLAVLNADGQGKLPDSAVQARIRALKGPIELKTYLSLDCTNCPDVVQALNQMALLHPDFRHEAVDGGLAQQEVERLGIQAVPSVFSGDKLLHVGRASLDGLLDALEAHFGSLAQPGAEAGSLREFDVVVVGGGPAGCAAAIYSARKGLRTALVAQRLGGQVKDTVGIENLISVPRTEGQFLAADLEKHVKEYPIELMQDQRVEELRLGEVKQVLLKGGARLGAPTLILAMGAKWRELGIPGEREHVGRGVAFCPHCDGPFYKGRPVAVVGGGNSGVEAAIDLAAVCSQVTLLEFHDALKADAVLVRRLRSLPNATVITGARTTEVLGGPQGVLGLAYQDRASGQDRRLAVEGVFVQIGLVPNSELAQGLLDLNRQGEIVVDAHGRTSAPGVYAAGDVTTVPFKQIIIAMGEGAKAALTASEDRMRSR
jgi:alkyl hydroperoxide reductase subunit F